MGAVVCIKRAKSAHFVSEFPVAAILQGTLDVLFVHSQGFFCAEFQRQMFAELNGPSS